MQKRGIYLLVIAVLGIMALGLVMLSSTAAFASESHGDPYSILRKQAMWLGIGLLASACAACMDYHLWQKIWPWLLGLTILMLALCFVPHIGARINGSSRWIRLGPLSFQPSEFAKLGAIAFLAAWYSKHEKNAPEFLKGFVFPLAVIGVILGLIAKETDLGSTMLIALTMFTLMFVAGSNPKYLIITALLGLLAGGVAIQHMDERHGRILAFRDLEKYKEGDGLQQYAALIALGSGGVEGLGLGNGRQKLRYLPYAHTDFIFPVVGEELGLRATLGIVFAFVVIIITGSFISVCAKDRFGMLLGFGFVTLLAVQAAVNIGMTTALLPNKGMPLPFVSYGGSNLSFCLFSVGVLISIHRQAGQAKPVTVPKVLRARTTIRL